MLEKIKIAAVKFSGLASGGTEKALQTIAANLPKEEFEIDYYYCDACPYLGSDYKHADTDPFRKKYLENNKVNLIKFDVTYKDVRDPTHPWIDTNFWDLFDEKKYDIIQTGRAGHPEYPFIHINETPQIDLITLPGMAERKSNVFRTVHISQYQANTWISAGGDASSVEVIPLFDELPSLNSNNLRKGLNLNNKFVFGLHQRNDDGIYSPIPLLAYSNIETDNTAFVLMGGSQKYREQAQALNLKNFYTVEHSGDKVLIQKFLETLDVYSHGRADGETFSLAIAEAMYHGIPIVSHAAAAMGHVETIGNAGTVANSIEEYTQEMKKILVNKKYHLELSKNAKERYQNELSLEANMKKWILLYKSCVDQKQKDSIPDENFWEDMWEK